MPTAPYAYKVLARACAACPACGADPAEWQWRPITPADTLDLWQHHCQRCGALWRHARRPSPSVPGA